MLAGRMEECSASGQAPALPPPLATPAGQQQAWHPLPPATRPPGCVVVRNRLIPLKPVNVEGKRVFADETE